jgi:uncharacterized protein (TIGR04255 family)
LLSEPGLPNILRSDPGLVPLLDTFGANMKKAGYIFTKDLSLPSQTGAYGVVRRFFLGAEKPFPIMQIGPGIFASNSSTSYDWRSFKGQVLKGVRALLKSYPQLKSFPIKPNYLELRYIDVFDKSLLGRTDLFYFAKHGTTLGIELPKMLNDRTLFSGEADGRFQFRRGLKGWKETEFIVDFGSGKTETGENITRLESKVIGKGEGIPVLKGHAQFEKDLVVWLERAHKITSPFFKQFLTPNVMEAFEKD